MNFHINLYLLSSNLSFIKKFLQKMYVQLFFFLQRKGGLKKPRLASHLSLNSLEVLL